MRQNTGKKIPECHVCGKPAEGTGVVEGARVDLCDNCADYARDFRYYPRPEPVRAPQAQQAPLPMKKTSVQFEIVADYAKRLREAREKKGWTREDLGKQTLISHQEINSFEEGRVKPKVEQARKLEFTLGVKLLEAQEAENAERTPITETELERMARDAATRRGASGGPTLADLVEVKKRK